MLSISVLVSGGGTNLQAIIDAIEEKQITRVSIGAVISNNEGVYALERAREYGIPSFVLSPRSYEDREAYDEALLGMLEEAHTDLVVLAGFLVKIGPAVVQAYAHRIINIHPSLIPSFCGKGYYGLKVHEAALERGVKVSGATVHFVDDGTDTGPIISQRAVQVEPDDTPEILQRRIMEEAEWKLLPAAINDIAHGRLTVSNGKVIRIES